MIGSCDGVEPRRHVLQLPKAFERLPARRGNVVLGERAGVFLRTEPTVNSNRMPVNSRNSRRAWGGGSQANRDDRGQDGCDPLQHGAILLGDAITGGDERLGRR